MDVSATVTNDLTQRTIYPNHELMQAARWNYELANRHDTKARATPNGYYAFALTKGGEFVGWLKSDLSTIL